MDGNLEAMLENDKQSVNDRIANLEKRVQNQDNEIILLRSSLADMLRRVQQIEQQPPKAAATARQPTAVASAPSVAKKPVVAAVRASTATAPARTAVAATPRLNKASSQTNLKNAQSSSTGNIATASAAAAQKSAATKQQTSSKTLTITATKEKEASYQYNSETNIVKMFLRGRPVTLNLPETEESFDLDKKIKAPKEQLKLEWVYGYRGKDCRSNLYQLATGEILYFIASTVVLYNADEHSQRHYLGHTDDIKCLAIHPDGNTIATGQVAGHDQHEGKPHIRIWDSVNLNTIKTIGLNLPAGDSFQNAIACLSFSKTDSGQHLCVVDDAGERVISVWNWQNGTKVVSAKCYGDLVFAAEFHPTEKNLIVSCGKQHVFFWTLDNSQLSKKAGTFDKIEKPKYILSIGFLPTGEVITGDSEGSLLIWNNKEGKVSKQIKEAHEGGVFSILVLPAGGDVSLVTGGGKDGKLVEWNSEYQKTGRTLQIPEANGTCRFVSQGNGNLYLVGTTKNCILKGNFDVNLASVMNGHVEELWGLAVNPREATFLTCGNDRNIFYWDLLTHSLLWSLQVQDSGTDQSGAHCAHFHPNASVVAIGHTKNKWSVYDINERKCVFAQIEGTEQIECIQYSPDGQHLAAGSRDNSIYIYNVNEDATKYIRVGRCQGHSSFITHIDWSADSESIMSNSGDYEILFWNAATCKQITQAQQMRNTEWATQNCILTPNTFGIWGACDVEKQQHLVASSNGIHLDGTDINSSCVSQGKHLVVSGDDFGRVNLYTYPANSSKCEKRAYHGHSSHVTSVKFLNNDTRVVSTGGNDTAIFEWSVISE